MSIDLVNLSHLVGNTDIIADLQALELDGRVVGFQWLGPHFLALLRYAKFIQLHSSKTKYGKHRLFLKELGHLEYSASKCITSRGEKKQQHYKEFLGNAVYSMPCVCDWFMFPRPRQDSFIVRRFIEFLRETIERLLNSENNSGAVAMTGQVKFLFKHLEFLLSFLFDSAHSLLDWDIFYSTEIEAAGLFLYSFFFTTQIVTSNQMEQHLSRLVPRIKGLCVAVSKTRCGIDSLQVAQPETNTSEISSSIVLAEEIIVGLEDITTEILDRLLGGPSYRQIISIVGTPGLGKTTLAKRLYNDACVQQYFDTRSWCVVSQSCRKKKLLMDLLRSVSNLKSGGISMKEEEMLAESLYKSLRGRRYLIIMDDLWDKNILDDFSRLFPDINNGSRVLFTSRLKNVAMEASQIMIEPPPLSPDQCWDLLEKKVFKNDSCPQELQDIGKQIATNCQGIPLSVVTMAGVLSNMKMEKSLWQQVAKSSTSYLSQKADDYIPILKLSYIHLPAHLKKCFLYLCAFQEDEEIPVRYLLFLWIAEGFIKQKEQKSLEDVAEEYLMELINRSLLQVAKRRSDNGAKMCTLHDLILIMSWKIAVEEEFLSKHQFLISRKLPHFFLDQCDRLPDAISIHYNSEMTRILDFPSRLITCDLQTSMLPNLSYLRAEELDLSIDKFQNLVILVLERAAFIPKYFLNMPKLRHLYAGTHSILASRFSRECDIPQENSLQTLSFIHIFDLEDEEILKHSPELRRLKCRSPQNRFPNLNFLSQLESLKMVYELEFKGLAHTINFPTNIRKLTVANIGLPWEEMSLIGKLPNLEILKLKRAFEGETWDTKDDEFQKLKFLKISEHHFLVKWNSSSDHFPRLERLVLHVCPSLEAIPGEFSNIPTLEKIEICYPCSVNVKNSALQIREEQEENGNQDFELIMSFL